VSARPLVCLGVVPLFVDTGRAVRVLRARWSRCNPVHISPTVRVSQMCSVFLQDGVEWRKKREFGFLGVKRRMPFFH